MYLNTLAGYWFCLDRVNSWSNVSEPGDGFRVDKATQVIADTFGDFSQAMRECAANVGKDNFFITGEIS
jgi:hypothetical protein